jgi:hypothetical protein
MGRCSMSADTSISCTAAMSPLPFFVTPHFFVDASLSAATATDE